MRYITVPEPILLTDPETGEPLRKEEDDTPTKPHTLWTFIRRNILTDAERFGANADTLITVMQVKEAFEGKGPGDTVEVEDATWKLMCTVLNEPKGLWPVPLVAMQLLPFIHAIRKADDKKPSAQLKAAK